MTSTTGANAQGASRFAGPRPDRADAPARWPRRHSATDHIVRYLSHGIAAAGLALGMMAAAPAIAADPIAAQSDVDWPTFGFDSLRTGYNPAETILSPATVPKLALAWAFNPGSFDVSIDPTADPANGTFVSQPVLAHHVPIGRGHKPLLLIGDNNGTFFALDAHTANPAGHVVWYQSLGRTTLELGGGISVIGIRATAAIDRKANGGDGAVYVGFNGKVHAMDLRTGTELAGWPVVVPDLHPPTDQGFMHDGINIVKNRLYVGTSSFFDDVPFYGRLLRIDPTEAKVKNIWWSLTGNSTPPPSTSPGGGVWGEGGVAVDPSAQVGGVYVATGDAKNGRSQRAYAEQVVNLSIDLTHVISSASPPIPAGDYDYSSTPVVFQPSACPTKLLGVLNKSGLLVIETIGADGALAVLQSTLISITRGLRGNVAWDPIDQLLFVTNDAAGPAPYAHGLSAFQAAPGCTGFNLAWQTTANMEGVAFPTGAMSSPTVANGLVYVSSSSAPPQLLAIATADGPTYHAGQVLWEDQASAQCVRTTSLMAPIVVDGWVFLPCMNSNKSLNTTLQAFSLPRP